MGRSADAFGISDKEVGESKETLWKRKTWTENSLEARDGKDWSQKNILVRFEKTLQNKQKTLWSSERVIEHGLKNFEVSKILKGSKSKKDILNV